MDPKLLCKHVWAVFNCKLKNFDNVTHVEPLLKGPLQFSQTFLSYKPLNNMSETYLDQFWSTNICTVFSWILIHILDP